MACAFAEQACSQARLAPRLSGADTVLFGLARDLAEEAAHGGSSGARYWTELTDGFLDQLSGAYVATPATLQRGVLGQQAMDRVNRYVEANLSGSIDVESIADVAGQGRSHFPRVFRRSTGMSPYRYVVCRRLKAAVQLLGAGDMSIAEVAAATGFADQSHLTNWLRRVYGVSPARTLRSEPRVREATVLGSLAIDGGSGVDEFQAVACYH